MPWQKRGWPAEGWGHESAAALAGLTKIAFGSLVASAAPGDQDISGITGAGSLAAGQLILVFAQSNQFAPPTVTLTGSGTVMTAINAPGGANHLYYAILQATDITGTGSKKITLTSAIATYMPFVIGVYSGATSVADIRFSNRADQTCVFSAMTPNGSSKGFVLLGTDYQGTASATIVPTPGTWTNRGEAVAGGYNEFMFDIVPGTSSAVSVSGLNGTSVEARGMLVDVT